jgi:hypothetical protein
VSDKRYMGWEDETPEDRDRSRRRGYRDGLTPSRAAQERYPVSDFPCPRCEAGDLPYLADHGGSEFYWEHRAGRFGCARFGTDSRGERPRAGTATSLWIHFSTGVSRLDPDRREALSGSRLRSEDAYNHAARLGWAEKWPDILEHHRERGKSAREIAAALGYSTEEIETILRVYGETHDHYNHPNYDDQKAMEAAIKGERYDPADP